jgi:hypothetical protein
MENQLFANVRKKFEKIREFYKLHEGFKKHNILPIIGISKPHNESSKGMQRKFSITDLIK